MEYILNRIKGYENDKVLFGYLGEIKEEIYTISTEVNFTGYIHKDFIEEIMTIDKCKQHLENLGYEKIYIEGIIVDLIGIDMGLFYAIKDDISKG